MVTTKWTRPAATDGLSYSPTAPSSAKSVSTAVTRSPSPHVDGPLLQQPARLGQGVLQRLDRQEHTFVPRLVRLDRCKGRERFVRLAVRAADRLLSVVADGLDAGL